MKRWLLVAAAVLLPWIVMAQGRGADGRIEQLRKFNSFYGLLTSSYVDSIDYQRLVDRAIVDVLESLDPHSSYLTAEEMTSEKERLEGSFSGIGVEFNVIADTIIVVNVIGDAPASRAGMMAGDRIVEVDGKSAVGVKRTDVPKLLRGPKGSRVDLGVVYLAARTTARARRVSMRRSFRFILGCERSSQRALRAFTRQIL